VNVLAFKRDKKYTANAASKTRKWKLYSATSNKQHTANEASKPCNAQAFKRNKNYTANKASKPCNAQAFKCNETDIVNETSKTRNAQHSSAAKQQPRTRPRRHATREHRGSDTSEMKIPFE
jgi:hypothetical protein